MRVSKVVPGADVALLAVRLALAADVMLDACRGLRVAGHIGGARLEGMVGSGVLTAASGAELVAAALLAGGWGARAGAVVPLVIGGVSAVTAVGRIGGLGSAGAFDAAVHGMVVGGAAACVLGMGAGAWTVSRLRR